MLPLLLVSVGLFTFTLMCLTAFDFGKPVHNLHNATVVSVAQGVDTPIDKRLAMLFEGCF